MMGYGWDYSWMLMLIGVLILIGIIVLIIYALVRNTRNSVHPGSSTPQQMQFESTNRALAILAERYAKGEITDEEYKQKKSEILKS